MLRWSYQMQNGRVQVNRKLHGKHDDAEHCQTVQRVVQKVALPGHSPVHVVPQVLLTKMLNKCNNDRRLGVLEA